jgi:serine/threonine protein kinase
MQAQQQQQQQARQQKRTATVSDYGDDYDSQPVSSGPAPTPAAPAAAAKPAAAPAAPSSASTATASAPAAAGAAADDAAESLLLPGYSVGRVVGEGGFCQVRLATHHLSRRKVAVKVIDKTKLSDHNEASRIQREIRVLKRLNHAAIIRLFEVLEAGPRLFLVMEYAPAGSLLDYVRGRKRLGEGESVFFLQQIVAGLQYCHDNEVSIRSRQCWYVLVVLAVMAQLLALGGGTFRRRLSCFVACCSTILHNVHVLNALLCMVAGRMCCVQVVHRDIKLENILLDATNNMKLIDFGLAAFYAPGKKLRVHCGSPSYAAPEIVARKLYEGPPVDVWSLGVVLFAMLAGFLPFHSPTGNKQVRYTEREG